MKVSKLLGKRFKENPSDSLIESYRLMIRGGYMKQVGNGIYSLLTPAKRIVDKVENILREEMDKIDGQEVLFPVVMPATLWQESGRYESVGKELMRVKDRSGSDMVLGMTHEEAAVHLARDIASSYTQLPFMIYQIQTKFRDEPRSRGGLIRVREFTMKDGYSFHTSQEDLERYYKICHNAYERIFSRVGIPEVISVESDSGMMGGSVSHEFMLVTDAGEDHLAICSACDYRSNLEVAECVVENSEIAVDELKLVETPDCKSIEEVAEFLNIPMERLCKAVVYQKNLTGEYVIVFIRGDLDVSEVKLRNHLKEEVSVAGGDAETILKESGIVAGYIGAYQLDVKAELLFDRSLSGINSMVCGGNEDGYHYTGFNLARDYGEVGLFDLAQAVEGGICPKCGAHSLTLENGIEVGNIFQLGTKYSEPMGMEYTDVDGALKNPIMGCYGIGVGRLVASVCEVRHDNYGPIWPMSIAPWQVQICALKSDDERVRETADRLYDELKAAKVEVIYDDRKVSAGNMFSDADLFGVPLRIVVSPKTCERGAVEFVTRDKSVKEDLNPADATDFIKNFVKREMEKFEN